MVAPIVDGNWLGEHPEAVLADVRWYADGRSGQAAYEAGHLPGAVFVDLDRWLAGPPSAAEGRHPLPDPQVFAEGMRSSGISDDDVVVAYDDDSGAIAARLVWLLRVTGHRAALLDGGFLGWRGRRETGTVRRPEGTFTPTDWPAQHLVAIDKVTSLTLLDARPAERYRGDVEPLDARPGHVPGARSLPCRDNVDAQGRLLPVPELRSRLAQVGVVEGAQWASSCGSGVTACHTLLVAEHLSLPPGRLYAGSWSQWSHTDRPAVLGDEPG
ncbi:MAG: rhodanese-like domain-containing protein [Actinomycetota bacterium]|nr:rhodanese-like domain-containing protein [Actinomycetota bacterium]